MTNISSSASSTVNICTTTTTTTTTRNDILKHSFEYGNKGAKVKCIDISSNNKYVILAINGRRGVRTIQIRDIENFNLIREFNKENKHTDWIICVKFTKDCNYVLSSSYDRTVKLWDAKFLVGNEKHDDIDRSIHSDCCLTTMTTGGSLINCIDVSPNNKYFATVSLNDKTCRVFSLPAMTSSPTNTTDGVIERSLSTEGTTTTTATTTGGRLTTMYRLNYIMSPIMIFQHADMGGCIAFKDDSKSILSGSLDGSIRFFNIDNNINVDNDYIDNSNNNHINNNTATSSSNAYYNNNNNNNISSYRHQQQGRTTSILPHKTLTGGHHGSVHCIASSSSPSLPNTKNSTTRSIIVSGGLDNKAIVWKMKSSKNNMNNNNIHKDLDEEEHDITERIYLKSDNDNDQQNHTDWVNSIAISSDSTLIVTVSKDSTIKIWNIPITNNNDNKCHHNLHQQQVSGFLSSSPPNNNKYLLMKTLNEHTESINSVVLSSDNQYLITASDDSTCKVFNMMSILRNISWNDNNVGLVVMLRYLCDDDDVRSSSNNTTATKRSSNNNTIGSSNNKKKKTIIDGNDEKIMNVSPLSSTSTSTSSIVDLVIKEAPDNIFYYVISFLIHPLLTSAAKSST